MTRNLRPGNNLSTPGRRDAGTPGDEDAELLGGSRLLSGLWLLPLLLITTSSAVPPGLDGAPAGHGQNLPALDGPPAEIPLVQSPVGLESPAAETTLAQSLPAATPDLVVLVHGMGRSPLSMLPLDWALEREGYRVLNWGYSSTCCGVAELGRQLEEELRNLQGPRPPRVHFVGHSLGGVIIRWLLVNGDPGAPVGRVVMIAPPNRGSHVADQFAPWLGWLFEPLPELRTSPLSAALSLPVPPGVPVAVIAGKDDGKVSVAETHLTGESAHYVVPGAHSFLMFKPSVQQLTIRFLRDAAGRTE